MEEQKAPNSVAPRSGIVLGILFGLVSAGFYVTPAMFLALGIASASTVVALQGVLLKDFGIYFIVLGALLAGTTILIYLRKHHVAKLTMSDIKPYRAFIGGMVSALILTYAILVTIAIFRCF